MNHRVGLSSLSHSAPPGPSGNTVPGDKSVFPKTCKVYDNLTMGSRRSHSSRRSSGLPGDRNVVVMLLSLDDIRCLLGYDLGGMFARPQVSYPKQRQHYHRYHRQQQHEEYFNQYTDKKAEEGYICRGQMYNHYRQNCRIVFCFCFPLCILQCLFACMLQCFIARVLQCFIVRMLQCFNARILHCFIARMFIFAVFHCSNFTVFHCSFYFSCVRFIARMLQRFIARISKLDMTCARSGGLSPSESRVVKLHED